MGYSAADVREFLLDTWNYLQCTTTGDGSDPSRSDVFALNSYSWCGEVTYQTAQYDVLVKNLGKSSVPVFFSEYGCNVPYPRVFTEVPALYGPLFTPVLQGGVVYEYSQEPSNYGLVKLNPDGSAECLKDYDTLQSQFSKLNGTALQSMPAVGAMSTPPACSSSLISHPDFAHDFTIPAVPQGVQGLIDHGIKNAPVGKIIPVTSTKVPQQVKTSNGDVIPDLAITPLAGDQSNNPSMAPTTPTHETPATTTKKAGAGNLRAGLKMLAAVAVGAVGWTTFF